MRPASHIPLEEIITLHPGVSFMAFDSSVDSVVISPSKLMGFMPLAIRFAVSASQQMAVLRLKTLTIACVVTMAQSLTWISKAN